MRRQRADSGCKPHVNHRKVPLPAPLMLFRRRLYFHCPCPCARLQLVLKLESAAFLTQPASSLFVHRFRHISLLPRPAPSHRTGVLHLQGAHRDREPGREGAPVVQVHRRPVGQRDQPGVQLLRLDAAAGKPGGAGRGGRDGGPQVPLQHILSPEKITDSADQNLLLLLLLVVCRPRKRSAFVVLSDKAYINVMYKQRVLTKTVPLFNSDWPAAICTPARTDWPDFRLDCHLWYR